MVLCSPLLTAQRAAWRRGPATAAGRGRTHCHKATASPRSASPTPTHGWAVGSSGTIVATSDGGAHWQVQTSGTDADLSAVAFPDATHGWAVGR